MISRIPRALPVRFGESDHRILLRAAEARDVILAGDYLESPSINGAMVSGRKAAEAVMRRFNQG
jgi:predicted NAD/FAD-dependent oxidoreductase